MTSVNLLSTTTDGQQVFLTQPILAASSETPGIIFAEQNKTIVLQDGDSTNVNNANSGVEYTIIEDPSGGGGGFLQIANAGQAVQAENIVFSQEELYSVLSGVALQNEPAPSAYVTEPPTIIEKKFKRPGDKLEKPIGKGPYKCEICPSAVEAFETWGKFKKHMKVHEEDRKFRCLKCPMSFNVEKNLRLHNASHNTDDLVCPECKKHFSRIASFRSHLTIHEEEDDLSCHQCEALFSTEANLNYHLEYDHDTKEKLHLFVPQEQIETESKLELKFTCKMCNAKMNTLRQYNSHMEHHNKLKDLLKLKQKKKKKVHPAKEKYFKNTCQTCGKKFQKPSQLLRHERIHNGDKPFVCEFCKKAFNQKNSLELHLRRHTGEKPYKCEFCQMGFTQNGNLRAHIKRVHSIETDEPLLKCDECSCTFKKVGSLNSHFSRVHTKINITNEVDAEQKEDDLLFKALSSTGLQSIVPNNKNEKIGTIVLADKAKDGKKHLVKVYKNSSGQKIFLCNFCPKEFKKPSEVCRHLRLHSLEKPFKCRLCSRSFAVKTTYQSHMKIHTGKDHLCTVCLKRYKTLSLLRQHEKIHEKSENPVDLAEPLVMNSSGFLQETMPRHRAVYHPTRKELMERNYRCSSCPAAFKKVAHLRAHNLRHTGEKPFKCEICDKKFVSRGGLNEHMRSIHTRDTLFQCSICPLTFTTKGSTRRHIASAHRKERPFICPFCQKTFKTSVLCKKHMKIHRKEVVFKQENEPQPVEMIKPPNDSNATFFTADSSGTVTLPNLANLNQSEIMANIASDGTITLQQNDLDWTGVQLNDAGIFQLPNIVVKKDPKEPETPQVQAPVQKLQFYCSFKKCGQNFDSQENLEDHMQTYHQPAFSPAKKQPKKMVRFSAGKTNENLAGNLKREVEVRSISEKVLEASLNERFHVSRMKDPLLPDEQNHPNKCNICPRTFKKPSDLIRHVRTHTGEKPFKCDECGKSFSVISTLNTHKKIHGRNGNTKQNSSEAIKCHICNGTFLSKTALKTHMRIHTGAKPFECPYCGERFRTSGHRKAHLMAHHPPAVSKTVELGPKTAVTEQKFSVTAESFTEALETASAAGTPLLGATVSLQLKKDGMENIPVSLTVDENLLAQLQRGENISLVLTNPVPAQATAPETDFNSVYINDDLSSAAIPGSSASNSILPHNANEDKVCPICKKNFTKPSMLQRHMRIHTGERPYVCHICQRAFNQKNTLQIHLKKHTGEKPHVCPFCKYAFTQKGNLKTHIQRSHPEDAKMLMDAHENNLVVIETI